VRGLLQSLPKPKAGMRRGIAFVALLALLIGYPMYCTYSVGSGVRIGMTREQVVAAVGHKPWREEQGASFPSCADPPTWYGDCAKLKASGASRFLIWRTGIDTLLVVGFDASDRVVFKGYGDN